MTDDKRAGLLREIDDLLATGSESRGPYQTGLLQRIKDRIVDDGPQPSADADNVIHRSCPKCHTSWSGDPGMPTHCPHCGTESAPPTTTAPGDDAKLEMILRTLDGQWPIAALQLRAALARAASCEQDKRRLDYLEGEAICDHPRALFRRNVPITREAIDADMAAPLRLSALASAGQGKERG